MSSTPLTENALSRPAGLVVSLRLLAAIVIFAAIAPGILMTAPAVAAQLASEWQLKPGQIGWLFSAELGAMSLATLPAWWWMSRLDWRRVALMAGVVFLTANLASAVVTQYETLLAARFIASLAGGTLMILCISCAAGTPNPSRVYAFWVLGQLLLGMLGLLALPGLFATFGLKVVYLILAAIMLCCLPLVSAFPPRFQPLSVSRQQPSTALWRQALAVLAVLTFYISLSAVWTFIGTIGSAAGLSPTQVGLVLAAATVCGIIGAGGAFNAILKSSGLADSLAVILSNLHMHPILLAWLVALILHAAVGSATVAMMGATAIVAPMLPLYLGVSPEIIAIAIGSGAIGCTIVTDSLFWLVKQYCGASLSETFKYYTTATFIASLLALAATFLLSFII